MKLSHLLACAALLATFPAHAQQEASAKGCKYVNVASVPLRYTGPGLELTMEGSLNGTPATLLVDTGASDTALTRTGTEPRAMTLWNTGTSVMGVGGYSRIYNTRFKEFRAGPVSSRPGSLRVIHDFGSAPAYDGIVGAPFLLQADLEFSLAEKQIRFFRPVDCRKDFLAYWDPEAVVLPFERSYSRSPNPHFTVLLNGKKLNAIIDSGASTTVVTLNAAKRAGLKLDAPGVERAGYSAGVGESRVARWVTVFDTLQLGAETIRNARVGVIDADLHDIDVLLGVDFLRAHRVLFAMSQEKLYISYIGGEPLGQRRGIEAWIQQEADADNTDAQMMLWQLYRSGQGVARDPVQAKTWLDRAAAGNNPFANFFIGRGHMPRRQYAHAARHLRLGLEKLPGDRSAALWLYLARLHLGEGEAARADLEKTFARDDNDQWPSPVARHFLGKIDEKELLEQARDDKARANSQVCVAKTMMAERVAASGDMEKAKALMAQRPECGPPPQPQPQPQPNKA
ncbi:retroviral-like aspartic protease family protein [Massilia yuzhufengensis]|uniref:Clan AA aspartic protease, TIGR02281 family n=1 Tax=Massilia yuzhufengensis TaxID=1164594 RepID=A0A1I1Q883_9BURK|nr:retroviral-like aspartic protease family protein [Massilia yuzhufengensis]SFD18366.1 clan AA aspartic protease, TIGR02281 family [Massilia yuzhufengensis]